jgi:hypothetical protein
VRPEPHDQLLEELCRVADRSDRLEAELAGESMTVAGSTGQQRPNPLLGALREERKMLDRLSGSLHLSMPGSAGAGRSHQRKAAYMRWRRPGPPLTNAGA